jgi:hypothetical protein
LCFCHVRQMEPCRPAEQRPPSRIIGPRRAFVRNPSSASCGPTLSCGRQRRTHRCTGPARLINGAPQGSMRRPPPRRHRCGGSRKGPHRPPCGGDFYLTIRSARRRLSGIQPALKRRQARADWVRSAWVLRAGTKGPPLWFEPRRRSRLTRAERPITPEPGHSGSEHEGHRTATSAALRRLWPGESRPAPSQRREPADDDATES